jgi:hypothetical protein
MHCNVFFIDLTDAMSATVFKQSISVLIPNLGLHAASYTGEVNASSAPHGRGSYAITKGQYKGIKYDGTFVNGVREGYGMETTNDGFVLQGQWKSNLLDGFGKVCLNLVFCVLND